MIRTRTPEEIAELVDAALRDAPGGDSWLFVYGSMAAGPPFGPVERHVAALSGWHRRFCLDDPLRRGTEAAPGLVLGLLPDGSCAGVAYRIAADEARDALLRVFEQEMALPWYEARWLPLGTGQNALAFVADPTGPLFAGEVSDAEAVRRLAERAGPGGSDADYLFETVDALERLGIDDPHLDALARAVRDRRAGCAAGGAR